MCQRWGAISGKRPSCSLSPTLKANSFWGKQQVGWEGLLPLSTLIGLYTAQVQKSEVLGFLCSVVYFQNWGRPTVKRGAAHEMEWVSWSKNHGGGVDHEAGLDAGSRKEGGGGVWMPAYIPGFNFHTSWGRAPLLPMASIYFLNCGVSGFGWKFTGSGAKLCQGQPLRSLI